MATTLRIDGLDAFLDELARLAPDLAADAAALQADQAERTAAEIRAGYPVVTGRLRASVVVQRRTTEANRVATEVAVTAPYARMVEFGTARTVPAAVFVPAMRRGRDAFVAALVARVRAWGLLVTGDGG